MDSTTKKELDYLRIGIQEAFLCSEFLTKYLDKGQVRDDHLKANEELVKCYCLLDNTLQIRPDIVNNMHQEQMTKLQQLENSETPTLDAGDINFEDLLSERVLSALKTKKVTNHVKFKDYKKKVSKLIHEANGSEGEDDLEVTEETTNLTDPISKTLLVDPVISLKCRHRFSRKTVLQHLQGKDVTRCPYMGCKEKFSIDDLEDDVIASQSLRRHQLQLQH